MIDLEDRVSRVFNPDVRPLVREAYRCYASGSARGTIVLTWTAVCADLIAKAQILHEEGESEARALVTEVERAQSSEESEAIPIMLTLEKTLLDTAEKLELIDFTERRQLERIRDDRHLCAHPSIRPLGELYEPTMEYARAHLAAALEAVLVRPPSQGRKIVKSFLIHVADPGFVFDTDYLTYTFFDRVRPTVQFKVVEAAAKFAVLAIEDEALTIKPEKFADRMARCLRSFGDRDAELAKRAVAKQMDRLEKAEPAVQLRSLGRLGDLPAFWSALAAPVRNLLNAKIENIGKALARFGDLKLEEAKALALVAHPELRQSLPALTGAFNNLEARHKAQVIAQRPDPYFTPYLAGILKDAPSYDTGRAMTEQAVLPCAGFLTSSELEQVLREWNDNSQCWGWGMPGNLVELYNRTSHLGPERKQLWNPILDDVRDDERIFMLISSGIDGPSDDTSDS